MNKWSPERAEAIRQFIDEYFMENRKSPTVRDIAAGTGISKTSVQRYLTDMKEHGEIEYNGRRSIGTNLSRNMFETTPAIRYDSTVSCGLPSEPNVEEAEIIPLPTALVGDGKFFILTAKGDSMTGIGVDDGDLVIVREQNTCRDGDYAVVLVNGTETLLKTITYLPDNEVLTERQVRKPQYLCGFRDFPNRINLPLYTKFTPIGAKNGAETKKSHNFKFHTAPEKLRLFRSFFHFS